MPGEIYTLAPSGSPIAEFYAGRSVFVTGGSGFVGKVLIEKLLRSLPDIGNIYVLIRNKRGTPAQSRINSILELKLFSIVRKTNPELFDKIKVISGNVELPDLGLSKQIEEELAENVSVVFNSAAAVKFNDTAKNIVMTNLDGTKNLITFCRKLKKLACIVHVSTAFANAQVSDIEEKIYRTPFLASQLLEIFRQSKTEMCESMVPHILGGRPNIYTLSKALSECLLEEEARDMHVAVVRPSMITATWKEPFAGWIDSIHGPIGILVGTSKGILKGLFAEKNCNTEWIPVDVLVNSLITAGWSAAVTQTKEVQVYNCTNNSKQPAMRNFEYYDRVCELSHKYPLKDLFWYPSPQIVSTRLGWMLHSFVYQTIPGFFIDTMCWLFGREQRLLKIYSKMNEMLGYCQFYIHSSFTFHKSKLLQLKDSMTSEDQENFYFDTFDMDWNSYFEAFFLGVRQYVLKEDISTVQAGRKMLRMMYFLRILLRTVLSTTFAGILWWAIKRSNHAVARLAILLLKLRKLAVSVLPKQFSTAIIASTC